VHDYAHVYAFVISRARDAFKKALEYAFMTSKIIEHNEKYYMLKN